MIDLLTNVLDNLTLLITHAVFLSNSKLCSVAYHNVYNLTKNSFHFFILITKTG